MEVEYMVKSKKLLVKCIAVPLGIGAVSGFITKDGMKSFETLNKPPLSPPGWLFPIVWTILYTLMGISSWLVLTSGAEKEEVEKAMKVYGYQLAVNFLWPTFFFNLQWHLFAFGWLALLWGLVLWMIRLFGRISKAAGRLNWPYLGWLTFAGYLNLGIWLLNRKR